MILLALDGTQGSWNALEQAVALSTNPLEPWLLVHVIPDPTPIIARWFAPAMHQEIEMQRRTCQRIGMQILESGKQRIQAKLGIQTKILTRLEEAYDRSVGQTLARIVNDEQPRLAILGAHGEHPEIHQLGRTANWVVQHEHQNTLIIHTQGENP
jgi:nucleotide-binding universal stress UspA family protein